MAAADLPFYVTADDPPGRRKILTAALLLFGQKGLSATSIRDIAAEAGLTSAALYRHFETKEALAVFLFEACHTRLWSRCAEALAGAPPGLGARIRAYVRCHLRTMEESPAALMFLHGAAAELWRSLSPEVRRRRLVDHARALADEAGLEAAARDVAAEAVLGTLAQVGRQLHVGELGGPPSRWEEPLVEVLSRILDGGKGPRGPARIGTLARG
jgi:TetR/AcrR family transcriptional regulator, repressor of fatR-cypB operon